MKKVIAFLKKKDFYFLLTRYFLALGMFPYAIIKILHEQFEVYYTSWFQTLNHLSGGELAWAFLGRSDVFQITLGFLELIATLLLLFRRTALLGAIFIFPMLIAIILIDYSFAGSHALIICIAYVLFALDVLILIFEWKRVKEIFQVVMGKGTTFKFRNVEWIFNFLLVGILSLVFFQTNLFYNNKLEFKSDALTGDWKNNQPNEWILQAEKLNDSLIPKTISRILYFLPNHSCVEIDGNEIPYNSNFDFDHCGYILDEKKNTLTFRNVSENEKLSGTYNYKLIGDLILQIDRVMDSSKMIKQELVFKRRIQIFGRRRDREKRKE